MAVLFGYILRQLYCCPKFHQLQQANSLVRIRIETATHNAPPILRIVFYHVAPGDNDFTRVLQLALFHVLQQHPHGSTETENLCCLRGLWIQIPPAWRNIPLGSTPGKVFPVWTTLLLMNH